MKLSKLIERFDNYYKVYRDIYKISKQRLWIDFLINYLIYGCSVKDYFTLEFPLKNRVGKKRIITATESVNFYKNNNDTQEEIILNDKEECLKLFDKYIRRSWIGVKYNNSKEVCKQFATQNKKCIVKPMFGCGGEEYPSKMCLT